MNKKGVLLLGLALLVLVSVGVEGQGDDGSDKWDFELQQLDANINIFDLRISIPICLIYKGQDSSEFVGKPFYVERSIFDTSFYHKSNSNVNTLMLENKNCEYLWGTVSLTTEQIIEVLGKYPDGNVPINLKIKVGEKLTDLMFRDIGTTIFEGTYELKDIPDITKYRDDYEYKIGVVQVVPPGYDLDEKELCFVENGRDNLGEGYDERGVYEDCWDSLEIDKDSKKDWLKRSVRPYKLTDILYSDEPFTSIEDVRSLRVGYEGVEKVPPTTIKLYSLKHIGKFWEDLLERHNIKDTRLRKNPRFRPILLGPFEKEYETFESVGGQAPRSKVKWFFREVIEENNVDLEPYDFVVYIQYTNVNDGIKSKGFRSFAAGRNAYVSFSLIRDNVLNDGFLSIVHELGHIFFSGDDLYDGLAIKYPKGVPDPHNFPNNNACIMTKSFANGLLIEEETVKGVYTYDTWHHTPSRYVNKQPSEDLDHFHTKDPANFVLCVDTAVEIMGGKENPDCPVADFYAGNCGDCNSLNYLSCSVGGKKGLKGDFDKSGCVDFADFILFSENFDEDVNEKNRIFNLENIGSQSKNKIDVFDFFKFADEFGRCEEEPKVLAKLAVGELTCDFKDLLNKHAATLGKDDEESKKSRKEIEKKIKKCCKDKKKEEKPEKACEGL